MSVKYLGDGSYVVPLGPGSTTEAGAATTTVFRVPPELVEDVDNDALLDSRPALHPETGRPLSETEPTPEPVPAQPTFSQNEDGKWVREDGVSGTFGPTGFVPDRA